MKGIYPNNKRKNLFQKGHKTNLGKHWKVSQKFTRKGARGILKTEETKLKIKESCKKNYLVVHHINGNHYDDRPENRRMMTRDEHTHLHLLQGDIKPYGGGRKKN
jgi:hypothetical protein